MIPQHLMKRRGTETDGESEEEREKKRGLSMTQLNNDNVDD